jgi:flagellar hook-basal body complex protein FliE
MVSVNNINGISVFDAAGKAAGSKKTGGLEFKDTLNTFLSQVNTQLQDADQMTDQFAAGKTDSLHEVMVATEKSTISLSLLLQIRNKLLEAYQEVMRMSF